MTEEQLPVRPSTFAELEKLIGQELGPTEWYEITQDRIDAFAAVTNDHQWIHVDSERAAASAFGTTIAHGLFSLSLGTPFSSQLLIFDGFAHSLDYGYDKVRFAAPVPVGSRLRMRSTVVSAEQLPGGIQVKTRQVLEREGSDKPVAVAEAVARVVEKS